MCLVDRAGVDLSIIVGSADTFVDRVALALAPEFRAWAVPFLAWQTSTEAMAIVVNLSIVVLDDRWYNSPGGNSRVGRGCGVLCTSRDLEDRVVGLHGALISAKRISELFCTRRE